MKAGCCALSVAATVCMLSIGSMAAEGPAPVLNALLMNGRQRPDLTRQRLELLQSGHCTGDTKSRGRKPSRNSTAP